MPSPKDRGPSEPTRLVDLLGYGRSLTRSDFYRLLTHMAVRLSDPETPEDEVRLIKLVTKALDEIGDRMAARINPPD